MIKLIIASILCVIAAVLGFYSPNFNNQFFSGAVNLIAVIAFYFQFLYDHKDTFYVQVNKKLQWFSNPKFDLIQTLNVNFEDDNLDNNFLENVIQGVQKNINQKFGSYAKVSSKPSNSEAVIELDQNGVSTLKLSLRQIGDDKFALLVVYKQTVLYKERIKKLEIIRNIFDSVTYQLKESEKMLQLHLFFEKKNPFYGYILKKNKGVKVNNFVLSFNINDEVDAKVGNHYLEINSSSYTEFNNVLEDVVILANVK